MMPRFCRRFGIALGLALLALVPSLGGAVDQAPSPTAPTWSAEGHQVAHRLLRDIKEAVDRVEPWLQRYGYGAVFALVGVEGLGIPAPGQTILEAGSVAAAAPDARLRIGWLLLAAFLAAALGNSLGYWIGRAGGRPLLRRLRIGERHLGRVEAGFDRYGGWLIVFARFFDGPRQLNGIAAGILEMPWARFTLFNAMGAALWVCFWGLGVYYIDLHLDGLVALIRRLNPWMAAATVAVLAALAVLYWLKSRRSGDPRA
jgi:membrane protein DedA with SNARE-associated domain